MEKRNRVVDIMKGIGILLVIYGHTIILNDFDLSFYYYNFVFSFHMPVFFFLSGYCYTERLAERSFTEFFCHRFIKLLIPSWVYINLLKLMRDGWEQFFTNLRMDLLYYVIPEGEWFLPTIFVAGLLLFMMVKIRVRLKNHDYQIILSILLFCLSIWQGVLIARHGEAWYEPIHSFVFFRLDHVFVAFSFALLGFTANNDLRTSLMEFPLNRKTLLVIFLMGLMGIRFTRMTGYINLGGVSYGRSIVCFYLNAVYWIAIIGLISRVISRKSNALASLLVFFGKRSLWVYLIHMILREIKVLLLKPESDWPGKKLFRSMLANPQWKPNVQTIVDFVALTILCGVLLKIWDAVKKRVVKY